VPPTINLDDPEDDLAVDVPTKAREMVVTAALNDSFGFGGHNASLLFHKL
jgi:3-oxoacyl-[acyl-carrier-protein] synthase II